MKQYVYKPYHSWRRGSGREKVHARIIWWLRVVLVAEVLILSGHYIEAHTEQWIREKEIASSMQSEESVFGIGFEPDKGTLFWFHRQTEMVKEE